MTTPANGIALNGNENWEYNEQGIMLHRQASINDLRSRKRSDLIIGLLVDALTTLRDFRSSASSNKAISFDLVATPRVSSPMLFGMP